MNRIPTSTAQRSHAQHFLTTMLALAFLLAGCAVDSLVAQDEDPFADPFGSPSADTATPDVATPTPSGRRSRPGTVAAPDPKDDPVVQAIEELNPETAEDIVRAIMILVDIDKVDLAKPYLDQLTALDIDDQAMFDLNMKFKSNTFVRLRKVDELLPDAAIFVRKLFAASDRYARDPERIAGFVSDLSSESPDTQVATATGLLIARENAVQPLMNALLDESLERNHPDYLVALARLGSLATEPLQAIAYSEDRAGFVKAAQVMVAANDRGVLSALLARRLLSEEGSSMETFALNMIEKLTESRPSRRTARTYLENRLEETQERAGIALVNGDVVDQWSWNPDDQTLSKTEVTRRQAYLDRAALLARTLHLVEPNDHHAQLQFSLAQLEARKTSIAPHHPIDSSTLSDVEPQLLEDVLVAAMKSNRIEPAIAAAELLGVRGDADFLHSYNGQPRAILRAVMHSNHRLRFAATMAVLKWDPKQAYAGSSHVIEAAGLIGGTTGNSKALVVEPNAVFADAVAGVLSTIGFDADATYSTRQFLQRAISSGDYEFAIIGSYISHPEPLELIQQIRRDHRTSGLPLVIVNRGEDADLPRLQRIAETEPNVLAMPWPGGTESVQLMDERIRKMLGRDYVSEETRVQQASVALDELLKIARNRNDYSFYKFLPLEPMIGRAVHHPELDDKAIELLGWLATPDAQLELVTIAAQEGLPVADRNAAVGAFVNAVNRRGILLTKREILRQYDRYNSSEFLSEESQKILADVLDAMENRNSDNDVETIAPVTAK